MKKLILVLLAIAFLAGTASAGVVTVTWDHNGVNTTGFTIYFWEANNIPDDVDKDGYRVKVDVSVREAIIDDSHFIPGTEYSFMGRAFNATMVSADSETVNYVFEGEPYKPPDVNLPPVYVPDAPEAPDGMKLESTSVEATFKYVPE